MKKLYHSIAFILCCATSYAEHITGGEMYYVLVNQNGNDYTYRVTLKLYRDCQSTGAALDAAAPIAIFNNQTGVMVTSQNINRTNTVTQQLGSPSPCIQNPPNVCYQVGYYEFVVTLPGAPNGYTIAYQRCCRIPGINNLVNSSAVGATYTAQIPGTGLLASAPANNSAHFIGVDTVITCAQNYFCYDFGAADADGDSLEYFFSSAFVGGGQGQTPPGGPNTPTPNPPTAPPYGFVNYNFPFTSYSPLGSGVSLNSRTGLMCGKAPAAGIYVVTVDVVEWRNGVQIAIQRKDLQIKVGNCNVAAAQPIVFDIKGTQVSPDYSSCNAYQFRFQNMVANNPLVRTYYWEFGDGGAPSTDPTPTHTYRDTGSYVVKLVINRGEDCSDSTTTTLRVFPGFFPGFTTSGICYNKPTSFVDTTRADFGTVNSWRWDFGKASVTSDTSRLSNPTYTFNQPGTFDVRLIVTSTKGCIDTVVKQVTIIDKPQISVAFRDTLICRGDALQLQAIGIGNFSWTPVAGMMNPNTPAPTVTPATTTTYNVQLDDNGCINNDSVKVRVITVVTLAAMNDTTICRSDVIQLKVTTDGLRYSWSPSAGLSDPNVLNPFAQPQNSTTYRITSSVGTCSATAAINVKVVPYPVANAGTDQVICFNRTATLNGTVSASSFNWSPSGSLNNPSSLTPVAAPAVTTAYVLSAFDTLGCPKPGRDTVIVTVLPKINAFAGKDTAVVIGQPLQLNATGGTTYLWSPATGLNKTNIANPVGIYDGSFDSIRYTVTIGNENGCTDVASVAVRIFKTNPRIFVPTAFTPNGDGRNDVLRAIPVGISKMNFFRVYNRWGQLVFSTTANGTEGWNGKLGGKEQGSATFVWIAQGQDFTGKTVFAKGTVTLVR